MRLNVSYDFETSDRAGAGGMFQIASVKEAETGEDLTRSRNIDVGMHFGDEAEVADYLRGIFGEDVEIESDD